MTCQHPNCSQPIHSLCTNHCHWSLCQEHINEHRKSLLTEFEEVLQDLIRPTNELSKSFEQTKTSFNANQQTELDQIKQSHQKEIHKIEQQLIEINKFQDQYNQISEHLNKIKTNENILTQNHFQQMDILFKEINQFKNSFTDKEENLSDPQPIQTLYTQCPLTSLNIYGLSSSHSVRLCSSKRKVRHLFEHFRNHHHLTNHYSNELIKAITLNLDPLQTKIFPSDTNTVVITNKKLCPLHNTPVNSGIHSTPCTSIVTDKFLPVHLKTFHRLRLTQIKEIISK